MTTSHVLFSHPIHMSDAVFCSMFSRSHVPEHTRVIGSSTWQETDTWHSQIHPQGASETWDATGNAEAVAMDQMEVEAAETLAALAHLKKRNVVAIAAKWGCKEKRVSSTDSSPPDIGLNQVQSSSDLAEDRATVVQQHFPVTRTAVVNGSVEAESLNTSHPCAPRYMSDGVVRSTQNVTEAEKEAFRLHRLLTNKESNWQMIQERQILSHLVGTPEKDIWEDNQQDKITGKNALIKSVKAEQNVELVKSRTTCATKYMSGGGGRPTQNLTEAEKEVRRLRRILANRESARQTIRRRQARFENLTLKAADLTWENENLKRAKELALEEYHSQERTNKCLKAEMANAVKAEEAKAPGEIKLAHQISSPSRNYPFFFYNQHPFPPFYWPSIIQSLHPVQSQCGHPGIFVTSSISTPINDGVDSSHDQENPINDNGSETLFVVTYPWFFSLPYHRNGLHSQPFCRPKDFEDESSVNNQFSAGCSLKPVMPEEKYNSSLPIEVEKEAYGSIEASPSTDRLPPDGGGQSKRFNIKEEVLVPTQLCSDGTTAVVEPENMPDNGVNTEAAAIRACQVLGSLPEENHESKNHTSNKAMDAVPAAEARKRRKELTKLKNLLNQQCRVR